MYNYKFENGHCIVEIDGKSWFLDTGCPQSFSFDNNIAKIIIDGREFELKSNPGYIRDVLEQTIGKKIDGIIGIDIINKTSFSIYKNNFIEFKANVNVDIAANSIDFKIINNIIIFKAIIENKEVQTLFDSGAAINYILPNFNNAQEDIIIDIDRFGKKIESRHCMTITYLGKEPYKLNFGIPMDSNCSPMQVMKYFECAAIIGLYDFHYKKPIFNEWLVMDCKNKKVYIK